MLIFLIGMMSSGKTTVGKRLAEILSYDFIDTDTLIEKENDKLTKDIIVELGIDAFRVMEHELLHHYEYPINCVVSTGGGIILDDDNILFMKNNGIVIYLETSVETLKKRLNEEETNKRPLLNKKNIEDIYIERLPMYEKACEFKIQCDDLNVDEICREIILKIT